MSAFLMLAASGPHSPSYADTFKKNSRRYPSSNMSSGTSGYTSRASTRSTTGNSSSGSDTTRRKIFDTSKLQYVDYESTLSLFERKLLQFNESVADAKKNAVGEPASRALNECIRSGGGGPLLTTENLDFLRYNYFEKFEPTVRTVLDEVRTRAPAYAHVIAADEKMERLVREEPPAKSRAVAAKAVRAKVAALERKLACPTVQAAEYTSGIRDAWLLSSFWDDVYHDIKCESQGESHYGWLPPRHTTQRFFVELADLALYRMRVVTCAVSPVEARALNADERHELARNQYFYFQGADSALMACLAAFVRDNFLRHIQMYVVCPDMARVRELMAVVVASVCDNLKLHFYGHTRAESATALFRDFLVCVLDAILLEAASPVSTPTTSSPSSRTTSVFDSSASENGSGSRSHVQKAPEKRKKGLFGRFRK